MLSEFRRARVEARVRPVGGAPPTFPAVAAAGGQECAFR